MTLGVARSNRARPVTHYTLINTVAKLPESAVIPPTVLAIFRAYEDRQKRSDWRRNHLGASQIGKECDRAIWYGFRWATEPSFRGRMLRLFDTGNKEEARLVADLRAVGVEVHEFEGGTRQQFRVSDIGGHFGGSMDGAARGFQESKAWHVLEFKTSNAKGFEKLRKEGVEKAKPQHFTQMQIYMHLTGMERAYYLVVCKDTDDIHGERVRYHAPTAWRAIERARRIIQSDTAPPRISDNPEHPECRWCDHRAVCHEGALPVVSCRSCIHATPEMDGDGRWSCARGVDSLTPAAQRAGCPDHLYLPTMTPWQPMDASEAENSITYADGPKNGGPDGMSSLKLREIVNADL